MGKVYTWDEILKRKIPRLDHFTKVIENLRSAVAERDSIVGALVCGSVIRGDHNARSDIDCLVLYDASSEEAFALMQREALSAKDLSVPLTFIPCDTELARTRMHHLGPSFLRHMEASAKAGGLLKGDPIGTIARSLPEKEELESYLRVKMYNLQESYASVITFSEEQLVSYLKKLLEAPMHIARKMLALKEPLKEDSKTYIRQTYTERMPDQLGIRLGELINLDELYTAELTRQLLDPNEERYDDYLGHFVNQSEHVLEFIRWNLLLVNETARS